MQTFSQPKHLHKTHSSVDRLELSAGWSFQLWQLIWNLIEASSLLGFTPSVLIIWKRNRIGR